MKKNGPRTYVQNLIWLGTSYYPALIAFWMATTWSTLILAERGVDSAWIGIFAGLPWVAVLMISPIVERLRDRLGWKWLYLIGNALAGISVAGFFFTSSFGLWIFWAFFSGSALAIRWIIADAWAAAITPSAAQGRMVGAFETLAGTAIAVGPALVAVTALDPFWTALVLFGLLVFSCITIAPTEAPQEMQQVAAAKKPGLKGVFAGGAVMMIIVFAGGFLETGVGSMLPVFGLARGLDPEMASLLMTAANASALFVQWPTGWLADRLGPIPVLRGASVLTLLASIGLLFSGSVVGLFITVFVWGGAAGIWYTLGRIIAGKQRPDAVVAVMTTVAILYTLGAVIGPSASGLAISAGGVTGFACAAVGFALLFGIAVWWRSKPRHDVL